MSESVALNLAKFKSFVATIPFNEDLDASLGQANILLFACRCEIDKIWATARNQVDRNVKMQVTAGGQNLLSRLGLVKKVERRQI